MLLRTSGTPVKNIQEPIVGKVSKNIQSVDKDTFYLVENPTQDNIDINQSFKGILTTHKESNFKHKDLLIYKIPTFKYLNNGDIISVGADGNINTLYRINSNHNTILATERCNSNCLMCSQPPRDKDDISYLYNIYKKLIPLIPKDCKELGISGGEPTIMGELFFNLLSLIKKELPDTEVHVLTNGRTFAWNIYAKKLSFLNYKRLMLGIPVYSDYYQTHDFIVQAENAFYQTILGIHNLARYNQRIEIRIVLHKQSIPRLLKLAKYIYKNLPFVEHIAFMGLEYIGYTPKNIKDLWIDPFDYKETLKEAVKYLSEKGMHVSIYNTPLCLIDDELWDYSRKSISDWKNEYIEECEKCKKLDDCGGFFRWNLKKVSDHIKAFE